MKFRLFIFIVCFPFYLIGQDLYFPPVLGNTWETTALSDLGWCEDNLDELFTHLENGDTKAFIVLKDGKIVIEKYFDGFEQNDTYQWNSAGKTMTSFLVGIAQQEGHLNISNKTSDYLGTGWTSLPSEKEDLITIRHQLTMTSGMDETGNGFCTDPTCLTYVADAGTRWAYHNGPYTLLDSVVESATGQNLNNYLGSKMLAQTGIGGLFIRIGDNKVFFSKPRNMARFGLLILNRGKWKNTEILSDQTYFDDMTTRSQSINKGYGYLWWLNDTDDYKLPGSQITFQGNPTPAAPRDMYSGIGKNGQFVDVVPSEKLVVVRMGDAPDDGLVPLIFHNEMWNLLSDVMCTPSSSEELVESGFSVFPNPFLNSISFEKEVELVQLFNSTGQLVLQEHNTSKIATDFLPKGIYFLKKTSNSGEEFMFKILKN